MKRDGSGKSQCPECLEWLASSKLKRHMQIHTGHYSFYCQQCKKGYNEKKNYEAHVAKHEGVFFPCNRCDRKFSSLERLKNHTSVHTGEWRFWCDACAKGFNQKKQFEIDQNKHLGNCFRCVKCGRSLYHEVELQKHVEKCSM